LFWELRKRAGRWPHRRLRLPFGDREINAEQTEVVRRILSWHSAGKAARWIAAFVPKELWGAVKARQQAVERISTRKSPDPPRYWAAAYPAPVA